MTQSIFAPAPNPHFLVLKFARALVLGEVLGCHMGAGGRLQNWDPPRNGAWTEAWAPWDAPEGDQEAAYAVLRNAMALKRGSGKEFLVFGKMLRPLPVHGIDTVSWTLGAEANTVPAVEHGTWQDRDGRIGLVLANWTAQERRVTTDLSSLVGRTAALHTCVDGLEAVLPVTCGKALPILLRPHACAVLIVDADHEGGGSLDAPNSNGEEPGRSAAG
jgi:hypothetical protein